MTHTERGLHYAEQVVAGEIPACKWVKLACSRHLLDLDKYATGDRFRFDADKADEVCEFIAALPHIKGEKAGQPVVLEPWQAFITCSVFGWVHRETGKRRFRRVYIEVPRGNGKSTWSSGVALYMALMDQEPGAEVYSAATTRDQARIVFRDAQHMLKKSPEIREALGAQVNAHNIFVPSTVSKFEALSAEGSTLDGLNTHLAVIDELHAHKARDVYDVIETSTGKREQSLLWVITTAGSNRSGVCYAEVRSYVTKVLENLDLPGSDSQFGIIYTIDEGEDWTSEASWRKANPNWGVSVRPDVIAQLAAKAQQLPAAQNNFKTKHLNVWVSADAALFDVEAWRRCGDSTLTREQFTGETCIVGLDLASKEDIAARVDVFSRPDEDSGKPNYYVFGTYYLPESAIHDSRNSQYAGWEISGRLVSTPGNATDFLRIEDDLIADSSTYTVEEIAFDPWQATEMSQRLAAKGATMVEMRPSTGNFSEPTKMLGALMKEKRIHHDGCPVMEWMISNVVGHYDNKDNVYPKKERPENKIDGVVALVMALGRWIRRDASDAALSAHYEQEGIMTV